MARGLELDDHALVLESSRDGAALALAERVVLATLAGGMLVPGDPHLEAAAAAPNMATLAAARRACPRSPCRARASRPRIDARARLTAGSEASRALVRVGRLLASSASAADVVEALGALREGGARPGEDDMPADVPAPEPAPLPPAIQALMIEMAARGNQAIDVSVALQAWGAARSSPEERGAGALAAAVVAERAGHKVRALEAYKAARAADPTNEVALRAIASHEQVDLVSELCALADESGRRRSDRPSRASRP